MLPKHNKYRTSKTVKVIGTFDDSIDNKEIKNNERKPTKVIAAEALKNNKNLDLPEYDHYLNDFKTFSQNIFAVESIFND